VRLLAGFNEWASSSASSCATIRMSVFECTFIRIFIRISSFHVSSNSNFVQRGIGFLSKCASGVLSVLAQRNQNVKTNKKLEARMKIRVNLHSKT
jgi:hypothetical protein